MRIGILLEHIWDYRNKVSVCRQRSLTGRVADGFFVGVRHFCLAGALTIVALSTTSEARPQVGVEALEIRRLTPDTASNSDRAGAPLRCFCPEALTAGLSPLDLLRETPWSLPRRALSSSAPQTIRILALRFNFPEEIPDNPLTSGNGLMDYRSPAEFEADYGHSIDPSPHDSLYFAQHLASLGLYYDFVSRHKLTLQWDVWPPGDTVTYTAPRQMAYYGDPDSVEARLKEFFRDCIRVADSVTPELHFADYQSVIIFHAGSDRQNDIGFPSTPHDLFTGFIKSADPVVVDSGSDSVMSALMMPEQASQDNRATALNAALAHEFGHQLGLVDLYSTRTGFTQLGDFALMDNNGFGVGIDFGFEKVFQTFGVFPIYMSAWSRAYLGFDEVLELPAGSPLWLAAVALDTSAARIAKISISKFEYFLVENRQQETDTTSGIPFAKADPVTGVIIGPARNQILRIPSGEYDFLLPGNGLLIYHVDESVAFADADGDGVSNFADNDLQWNSDRRFISLVEADGYVDLGGNYFKGVGNASDYWNLSGYRTFGVNTNPSTRSTTGANTHLTIEVVDTTRFAHNIAIDAVNSRLRSGFPVWAGANLPFASAISAELNGEPGEEALIAVGDRLLLIDPYGEPGWIFDPPQLKNFFSVSDTVSYFTGADTTSIPRIDTLALNILARVPVAINCGPIVAVFNDTTVVAVGAGDSVFVYGLVDANIIGTPRPDSVWALACQDPVRQILFSASDTAIYAATDLALYRFAGVRDLNPSVIPLTDSVRGLCAFADVVVALVGGSGAAELICRRGATVTSFTLDGEYQFGPLATDLNRDGLPEIIVNAKSGAVTVLTLDTSTAAPALVMMASANLGDSLFASPALSDFDNDGYPDLAFSRAGGALVVGRNLALLDNFPLVFNREYPLASPAGEGIVIDVDANGTPEMIVGAEANDSLSGDVYALGSELPAGFPLPAGGSLRGAPVVLADSVGASLGLLGSDGFFYRWMVESDTSQARWRMSGGNAARSNYFDADALPVPQLLAGGIASGSFYCYPNPVTGASATLRYSLGANASSVALTVFDMSGQIADVYSGSGVGGLANEVTLDCAALTPGIYRVRLEVTIDGSQETAFTDVAIVR